jgi:NitT/TauT family transport system permease protein
VSRSLSSERLLRSDGVALKLIVLISFLAAWEALVVVRDIRSYLLPRPSAVATFIVQEFPLLLRHSGVTAGEALAGLGLALLVGVGVAIAMVYSAGVRAVLMPAMAAFNSVPKVAFAPLIIVWFGLGYESKVITAFLICFFPIMVNTTTGMRDIEPDLLRLVKLMRASRRHELVKIRIPSALPALFDGLKIAVPLSIIGALVAEFIAASAGLGYLIISANVQLNTVLAFAAIVMIVAFSMTLYSAITFVERRVLRWRPSERV